MHMMCVKKNSILGETNALMDGDLMGGERPPWSYGQGSDWGGVPPYLITLGSVWYMYGFCGSIWSHNELNGVLLNSLVQP